MHLCYRRYTSHRCKPRILFFMFISQAIFHKSKHHDVELTGILPTFNKKQGDHVIRAMTLQRAAYRRANGGSRAPSLAEDAVVRYAGVAPEPGAALSFRGCFGELPELKAPWRLAHKTICRKTTDFEDEANEVKDEIPMRKTKSESTARTRMLTFSV